MKIRRSYLAMALGAACCAPVAIVSLRRVADAHRSTRPAVAATRDAPRVPAVRAVPSAPARPWVIDRALEGFDPTRARRDATGYFAELPSARRAQLTLDPSWQRAIQSLVASYRIPRAAVVVLDTDTARVRAYVSVGEPGAGDLARDPTPPAASVFKLVTSSALLPRGVSDTAVTCYSGGFHALRARDLLADARRDRECVTLGEAFGRSANTVFARRAIERLNPPELLAAAQGWGFNEPVPFDAIVPAGRVDVPSEALEFARTAAGFWHSHLSPLHAALLAQGVAHGGEMLRPYIVQSVTDAQGATVAVGAPHPWRRAVSPEVAAALSRMMVHSVSEGTAFHAFHDAAGRAYLPEVAVGGKTGTLTGDRPYRAYTWFVGNAAARTGRVSFAVMVANGPVWRIRAAALARQVLQIVYRGRATN